MQDRVDQGEPKERPERRLPRHKTKDKIGFDEGFVKGVEEEEVSPSRHPRPPGASTAEPSRIGQRASIGKPSYENANFEIETLFYVYISMVILWPLFVCK